MDLTAATTKELADELAKRAGVKELVCPDPNSAFACVVIVDIPGESLDINRSSGVGPARILVVRD